MSTLHTAASVTLWQSVSTSLRSFLHPIFSDNGGEDNPGSVLGRGSEPNGSILTTGFIPTPVTPATLFRLLSVTDDFSRHKSSKCRRWRPIRKL